MSAATAQPAAVSVSRWGELPAQRKLPDTVLCVLVAGQSAGAVERKGDTWVAYWSAGMTRTGAIRDRLTEHASADEAARAVPDGDGTQSRPLVPDSPGQSPPAAPAGGLFHVISASSPAWRLSGGLIDGARGQPAILGAGKAACSACRAVRHGWPQLAHHPSRWRPPLRT